jgi:Leucine-rich repeat (LRR) protein
MSEKRKSPRRWYQFSLRTLLLIMTLASGGFGWFAFMQRPWQRQASTDALVKLHARILRDHQGSSSSPESGAGNWIDQLVGSDPNASITAVFVTDPTLTDDDLECLRGLAHLPRLRTFGISSPNITDAGLTHLRSLNRIKKLGLGCPLITDVGLEHLQALPQLEELELGLPGLSDAGLVHLQSLPRLRELALNKTAITSAGLAQLAALPQLEKLRVWYPGVVDLTPLRGLRRLRELMILGQITDVDLLSLKDLAQLERLNVSGTLITDSGLAHLENLRQLKFLNLGRTKATNAGLVHLYPLVQLEELYIDGDGITPLGRRKLGDALPNLRRN